MNCIYCTETTTRNCSVEHVIPESFGNKDFVLPRGWVCDQCNNYFGRKVELPFMDSFFGRQSRAMMGVENKRGKTPPAVGFHSQSRTKVVSQFSNSELGIWVADPADEKAFADAVRKYDRGSLYLPDGGVPENNYVTARFACKVAIGVFAYQWRDHENGNHLISHCRQLIEIANYVRRGRPGFVWPVQIRRLHLARKEFGEGAGAYEVLNEFAVLSLPDENPERGSELYAVFAILGIEFVVNLGGPTLDRFSEWQERNDEKSYLAQCTVSD